jgi:hypothetical protein
MFLSGIALHTSLSHQRILFILSTTASSFAVYSGHSIPQLVSIPTYPDDQPAPYGLYRSRIPHWFWVLPLQINPSGSALAFVLMSWVVVMCAVSHQFGAILVSLVVCRQFRVADTLNAFSATSRAWSFHNNSSIHYLSYISFSRCNSVSRGPQGLQLSLLGQNGNRLDHYSACTFSG